MLIPRFPRAVTLPLARKTSVLKFPNLDFVTDYGLHVLMLGRYEIRLRK